ncbi:MAG: hypothetical protein AAGK22_04630 [Acidobacteriota bacterium]
MSPRFALPLALFLLSITPARAAEDPLLQLLLPALEPEIDQALLSGASLVERLEHAAAAAVLEARPCAEPSCDPSLSGRGIATRNDLHPFREVRFHWRARLRINGEDRPALVAWYQLPGERAGGLSSGPNGLLLGRVTIPIVGFDRRRAKDGNWVNVPRLVGSAAVLHRLDLGSWVEIENPWRQAQRAPRERTKTPSSFCDASCSFSPPPGF